MNCALWRSEFRNILAGYMRRGTLSLEQAVERQLAAQELLAGREYAVDSRSVLELVASSACTASRVIDASGIGTS